MLVSREFKIGIIVVLTMLFLFIGINFLKDYGTFGKPREFFVEFEEAQSLKPGDAVMLKGVEVGNVKQVNLKEMDASRVTVHFQITDDALDLPRNTEVWLINSDMLGTKALDIRLPIDSLRSNDTYKDGDFIDPDFTFIALSMGDDFADQFGPIEDKTNELIERVEDIILSVNSFWDTSAAYTIDASMYDVREASVRYKDLVNNMTNLIAAENRQITHVNGQVKGMVDQISGHSDDFKSISNNFAQMTNTFSKNSFGDAADSAQLWIEEMNLLFSWVGRGNGTIGKLSDTSQFMAQLNETMKELDSLRDHLEAKPRDFIGFSIFGLKAEGYQPDKQQKKNLEQVLDTLESGKKLEYK